MIPLSFEDAQDRDHPNHGRHLRFLYDLLRERLEQAHVNISHVKLPSYEQHIAFVEGGSGYDAHFIIVNEDFPEQAVGSLYVTPNNEIGLFVAKGHQAKGYGRWILKTFLEEFPGEYLANIHPQNIISQRLFKEFGFNLLQQTYKREQPKSS